MEINHLGRNTTVSQDLAMIESKNLKHMDKFMDQLYLLSDPVKYQNELRLQNYLWSKAFFDEATKDLKYQGIATNSKSFKFGFYIGLMMANKSARDKVFQQSLGMDIPPNNQKFKFMRALKNEERKGRLPFTPQSAAMMNVALTIHTYKAMQKNPEKADALYNQYHNAKDMIYKMAQDDGCMREDIDQQSRALTYCLVKNENQYSECFKDLNFGNIEHMSDSYDAKGNLVQEGDYAVKQLDGSFKPMTESFDVRQPLTHDMVIDKISDFTSNNLGKAISSSDLDDAKRFAKNYQEKAQQIKNEAMFDNAISEAELDKRIGLMPVVGGYSALRQTAISKFGKDTGQKAIAEASDFVRNSIGADMNSKDYKRRLYNFARDNPINGMTIADRVGLIKCLHKSSQIALTSKNTDNKYISNLLQQLDNDENGGVTLNTDKQTINLNWQNQANPLSASNVDQLDKATVIADSAEAKSKAQNIATAVTRKTVSDRVDKLRHKRSVLFINKDAKRKLLNVSPDRIKGLDAVDLIDKMVNKYGIDGLALAYDLKQKHNREIDANQDNRGQYLDISPKQQLAFKKQLDYLYKQDKYKSVNAAIDMYAQTMMQKNPEYEAYLTNSNDSPIINKTEPVKQVETAIGEPKLTLVPDIKPQSKSKDDLGLDY